jgi:hypothetical protein
MLGLALVNYCIFRFFVFGAATRATQEP